MKVLVISGSMGAGKTTMLGEASDVLTARGIVHAAIDADGLSNGNLPDADALQDQNLRAIVANYVAADVSHFLLAEALDSPAKRAARGEAFGDAHLVVCRLIAPVEEMQRRVRLREPGLLQETFVARVAELDSRLAAARVEDFSMANEGSRSVTEIAAEMLTRAGWIR